MKSTRTIAGFTLIEILVVVSIVSLVSSVAMYSTAQARVKAEDAKKRSEVHQVETAIAIKKSATGKVARNYNCSGTFCSGGTGTTVAREGTQAFNASMQELVDEGYLAAIPNSKDDSYVYYADSNADTAAFGAELKSVTTVSSSRSYCPSIPAPYTSCVNTMTSGGYVPAQEGPGVAVFREAGGAAYNFCNVYGSPTGSCWAHPGANGMFATACSGVGNEPLGMTPPNMSLVNTANAASVRLAQFSGGGPGGLPGFSLCTKAAVPYDITCNLPSADTVDTCAGGSGDYCACI